MTSEDPMDPPEHLWKPTACDRVDPGFTERTDGFFKYVRIDRDDDGLILAVVLKDNAEREEPPSDDMVKLHDHANAIARVIRSRFAHYITDRKLVDEYDYWMASLCASCRRGLLGNNPQPKAALATLVKLEEQLIIAARPQRRRYVFDMFMSFALVVIMVLALSVVFWLLPSKFSPPSSIGSILAVQANTIIGLSFGVLFAGIVQNRVLTFEALMNFDPDGFSPVERLLYVWVVASTLEVFIYFDVIVLGIGGTSFKDVFSGEQSPHLGILIGLVTAISTEAVSGLIKKSATPSNVKE